MLKSRRFWLALGVLALALGVPWLMGAATWTPTQTYSVKAVCSAGNEGATGPVTTTAGLDLSANSNGIRGFSVTLEMNVGVDAGAQNVVPSGVYMRAWMFNPEGKAPDGGVGGWWSRAPDLDLGPTTGGKLSESWAGLRVTAPVGRIAYLPESCGNVCTVYINGAREL